MAKLFKLEQQIGYTVCIASNDCGNDSVVCWYLVYCQATHKILVSDISC